uniref:Protein CLP1 homolog n=1 Tax=Panagrolaimus sp. JU765 TaxID=591449 RepID=A0AC34QUC1_9BILA
MESDQPSVRSEFQLAEDNELRFEVGEEEVIVELVEGSAEVFGTPLSLHKRYNIPPGMKLSIFTYKTALIEIVGKTESAYIAAQTPMVMYLNTHCALDNMRVNAFSKNARGPRVLIAGPTDVGKSTVSKILLNYAIRFNWTPIFVDLDVGQGHISIPGTIGALVVSKPADIVRGFDKHSTLAFSLGHDSPGRNIECYKQMITSLANAVDQKASRNARINASGVIINTCGWIKDEGYMALLTACKAFKVDVVIVLDHERLFNLFKSDLPVSVKIIHEPKSGGIEPRNQAQRAMARRQSIKEYFYGIPPTVFNPFVFEVSYTGPENERLIIAKIGTEKLPESCLPVGMVPEDHRTKVVKVEINNELKNHVLALMPPTAVLDQTLIRSPVIGYCLVVDVDSQNKSYKVLSPQPRPLPTKLALLSSVTYVDEA